MGGKKWSRKRKMEERREKSQARKKCLNEDHRDRNYIFSVQYSALMEAYYAYQGIFDTRLEGSKFVPCISAKEKEDERSKFHMSTRSILPASFRLGADCHPLFRDKFIKELDQHAGRPIEITLETNSNTDPSFIQNDSNEIKNLNVSDENKNDNDKATNSSDKSITTYKRILPPIRKIPFIPLGYQLSVDRRTIRRNSCLSEFHEWLKIQTNSGFITRQETVSMIPPVVLSVESHHAVLDMCAAPGSKTGQMLEIVSEIKPGSTEPKGFVVANDSDPKRAYMLINNLRRINSPAVFTGSVDAQFFPQLKGFNNTDGKNEGLFDRVLCDVPCSGDGTMRKNPGIWKRWSPLGSLALHPLQINIAMKGATLTKVGGYMCYSTCSMNPIENEAVVADILRQAKGSLQLVDKRSDMPGLVARPGWSTWKVICTLKKDKNKMKKNSPKMIQKRKEWAEKMSAKNGDEKPNDKVINTYDTETDIKEKDDKEIDANADENIPSNHKPDETDAKNDVDPVSQPLDWDENALREKAISLGMLLYDRYKDVPEHMTKRVRASCFPPTEEEIKKFHLEKCMRCLPHDMDTGGFFIALFHKVSPVGVQARDKNIKKPTKSDTSLDTQSNQKLQSVCVEQNVEKGDNLKGDKNLAPKDAKEYADSPQIDLKQMKGKDKLRGRGATRGDLGNSDFVNVTEDIFPDLIRFYGFDTNFPTGQIMARMCGDAKVLYFISQAIKERLIDRGIQRITVINSGLKAFERSTKDCEVRYRIAQEGIHMIAPYMKKRKLVINFKDFVNCLNAGAIYLETFSDDFKSKTKDLSQGSFVVLLEGYENDISKKMMLVMWRCRAPALNCLVSKTEIDAMKCKLRAIAESLNIEYDHVNEKPQEAKVESPKNKEINEPKK